LRRTGWAGQRMDQNEGVMERETWVTGIVSPYVYNERNEEDAILVGKAMAEGCLPHHELRTAAPLYPLECRDFSFPSLDC
jgi:hypothetical protein